ncbi:MAG: tetratricopeptide repeat protein, partial [Chloroflexi bacterium]|nr:tetratricopeptide repeat protein [Chloroflexota bacterium]
MAASLAFATKVVAPRRRSDALSRPRLLEALYRALDRRALTIAAPAGFGKTSLLADFAQQADMPVCWYALDPSDRDPRMLLTYLLTAIRRRFPEWGRRTEEALREADSSAEALTRVTASLVNDVLEDIPDRFMLILDDCHALEGGAAALHALNTFLQHLPENCHVILSGRTIPEMPALRRMLANRDLARLRAAELAFTDDEVRTLLLDHYCLSLTPEQTATIVAECEGWAGGLALAALALEEGRFPVGPGAAASDPEVFRYLAEEVLERQPERLQRFLLSSSVLADLRPEVCAAALGFPDAAACLHQAEERGLFISALEDGRAYRYHGMFVEFLRQQLRDRPDEWTALQTQAGRYFAAHGNWATAITHFMEGGDQAALADMLEQAAPELYDRGEWHTLMEWLGLTTETVRRERQGLTLWSGKTALRIGKVDEALQLANQLLEASAAELGAQNDSQVVHYAEALSLRAEALRAKGQTEDALTLSRDAIRLLERRTGRTAKLALAEAHHRIGSITAIYQARPREGLESLREALRWYEDIGSPYHRALVHNHLGVAFRNLGQFPQALVHYEDARGLSDQVQNLGLQASILNNIGNLYLSQRRYADAHDVLQQALERAHTAGVPRITAYAAATLGDLARTAGQWDAALQAYEQGASAATLASERSLFTYITAAQGLIYLHLDQTPRAGQLMEAAQELAVGNQGGGNRNFLDLTLGILYTRQGRLMEAQNHLLAAAHNWRRSEQREDWARASFHCAAAHYAAGERTAAVASTAPA